MGASLLALAKSILKKIISLKPIAANKLTGEIISSRAFYICIKSDKRL